MVTIRSSTRKKFEILIRLFLAFFAAAVILGALGIKAEAADSYIYNGIDFSPVYDEDFFIKKYPGIARDLNNDKKKIFRYFVLTGMKKGLQGSANFDVKSYAYRYANTRHTYKNNLEQYYLHYLRCGYPKYHRVGVGTTQMLDYETVYNGKDYSDCYNYNTFIKAHPEAETLYGLDDVKVLEYFVKKYYRETTVKGKTMSVVYETMAVGTKNDLRVISFSNTVGTGDATLLESNGSYLLIDAMNAGYANKILAKLKEYKATKLSIYISHYHPDHYGSLLQLLNNQTLTIEKLYLPDPDHLLDADLSLCATASVKSKMKQAQSDYKKITAAAKKRGIKVIYLKKGSSFSFGRCSASVYWGCNYSCSSYTNSYLNNNSLVTMFKTASASYLSSGDVEKTVQKKILKLGVDLKADFMELPHHGYANGYLAEYIAAVNPVYAFYTCSADTKFGKYSEVKTTVTAVSKVCNLFGRAYNGEIIFCANNGKIFAQAERNVQKKTNDVVKNGAIYRRTLQFNAAQSKQFITAKMTSS